MFTLRTEEVQGPSDFLNCMFVIQSTICSLKYQNCSHSEAQTKPTTQSHGCFFFFSSVNEEDMHT